MIRLAASLGLAAAIVCALVAPATAAGDQIGLSRDGKTWSADLAAPLFDPTIRWVPGDSRVETFLVRNQSSDSSTLDVTILKTDVNGLLDTGDLHVSAKVGNEPWRSLSTREASKSAVELPAGERERVSVRARFDADSTNQSQLLPFKLDFQVRLTQASASTATPPSGSPLPATGGPSLWLAAVGSAALAWGIVLVTRRRKEQTDA